MSWSFTHLCGAGNTQEDSVYIYYSAVQSPTDFPSHTLFERTAALRSEDCGCWKSST